MAGASPSFAVVAGVVSLLALAGCGADEERAAGRPPHVVFVLVDGLRADRVGWYGGEAGLTPFLDGLAGSSSVFWHAYAPSDSTFPVLASLFTSRFPSQLGIDAVTARLERRQPTLAQALREAGYATAFFSAHPLLNAGLGYGRGFELARVYYEARKQRVTRLTSDALVWLDRTRAARPEAPVFLLLHLLDLHEPWRLHPAFATVLERRGEGSEQLGKLAELAARDLRFAEMSSEEAELGRILYDAEVAGLDGPLQKLFEELGARGILSDAIVVVTSDHGTELLDHGGRGFGHALWDEVIRVPLLVKRPGQLARSDVDEVVSLVDLAPTLLEAAGLPAPPAFQGRSRLDALAGRSWLRRLAEPGAHGTAYSERAVQGGPAGQHARAVIHRSGKLIESGDGAREFYDLASDPAERRPDGLGPRDSFPARAELERVRAELARGAVATAVDRH
jgi:arylsulfatase A-like enzyme